MNLVDVICICNTLENSLALFRNVCAYVHFQSQRWKLSHAAFIIEAGAQHLASIEGYLGPNTASPSANSESYQDSAYTQISLLDELSIPQPHVNSIPEFFLTISV